MATYAMGPVSGDHQILAGHPASHGGLRLHLEVTSGVIEAAQIEHGFMNRGVEQLFPARDYRQGLMMANRHDWSAPQRICGCLMGKSLSMWKEHLVLLALPSSQTEIDPRLVCDCGHLQWAISLPWKPRSPALRSNI